MSSKPTSVHEADLQAFLELAGNSLAGAQGTLNQGAALQSDIVLESAELEAKVMLNTSPDGRLSVAPISSRDLVASRFNTAGISTLRINFLATALDTSPGSSFQKPARTTDDVIKEVRDRPDVASLAKILGDLTINAAYEPKSKRWLVTASDNRDRIVREVVIHDEIK